MGETEPVRLGAVVLSGGTAARLGGVDKASLRIGGVTLLQRALTAVGEAHDVVVVGEPVTPLPRLAESGEHRDRILFTREEPPGGGPAAALLHGVRSLPGRPELVVVLAVDMPEVRTSTIRRLRQAVQGCTAGTPDGAVLIDATGRPQPLCALYRPAALLGAAAGLPRPEQDLSVRALVDGLDLVEVAARGAEAHDLDTWDDVREAEHRLD